MAFKFRRSAVLAKNETVYATDAVPTGAANAMLMTDIEIEALRATEIPRDLQLPAAGQDLTLLAGHHVRYAGKVELAGSGTAGTAPKWGPLARACGLSQTIVADTSVTYNLVSANEEAATIYFYADGGLHSILGFRGKFGIDWPKLGLPRIAIDGLGLYVPVAPAAIPALTLTGWTKPKAHTKQNTPTVLLHGFAAKMPQLSIDLGQQLDYRDYANQREVVIADRTPVGSITIEAPDPATKNFYTAVADEALGALQVVHGTVAGNICTVAAPNVQLMQPRRQNDNNTALLQMQLKLVRATGDDEFSLALT